MPIGVWIPLSDYRFTRPLVLQPSGKIIPCVPCVPCFWRTWRRAANRESGRNVGSTLRPDFALLGTIRPDAIRTRTSTSCASWLRLVLRYSVRTPPHPGPSRPDAASSRTLPSWRRLIYNSPALTTSDLRLSRPDDVWSKTLAPRCRFLLTERQGFVDLTTSRPDCFCSCLPRPDPTILISPFLKSGLFFLILPPIQATSWSNRDSIRRPLVISDASWTKSDAILVLRLEAFPNAVTMSFTVSWSRVTNSTLNAWFCLMSSY